MDCDPCSVDPAGVYDVSTLYGRRSIRPGCLTRDGPRPPHKTTLVCKPRTTRKAADACLRRPPVSVLSLPTRLEQRYGFCHSRCPDPIRQ